MNYLPKKVPWSPFNVALDVTNVCNFKCIMCTPQYIKEKNSVWSYLDYLIATKSYSPRSHVFGVTGEPLLNKNLKKMIEDTTQRDIKVIIATNGSLLNSCAWLPDADVLKISLHSCTEEGCNMITGVNSFNQIISTVKKIVRLGKPIVRFEFVVMGCNYEEMVDFVTFVHNLGVKSIFFRALQGKGLSENLVSKLFKTSDLEKQITRTLAISRKLKIHTNLGDWKKNINCIKNIYERKPTDDDRRKHICLMPWTQLVIFADGRVSPCCCLSQTDDVYFGDAFGGDNAWNSSKMKELRQVFREKQNYDMFTCCSRCEYLDFRRLLAWTRLMPKWFL